ncbi:MAG TPA: response regulator, partial [Nitrospiria bacterium]
NAQIQTQLEGLLRMPDMEYLGIRVDGRVQWEVGKQTSKKILSTEFPLIYTYRGEDIQIGVLKAVASLDNVYQRTLNKAVIILLSNGLKTFLVAGFIFILFRNWVTRYLDKIADYARHLRLDQSNRPLDLGRKAASPDTEDELDQVASAINEMRQNLVLAYTHLQTSEADYRDLFENSPAPLWEMDLSDVKTFLEEKDVLAENGGGEYPGRLTELRGEWINRIRVVDLNPAAIKLFEAGDKEDLKKNLLGCFSEKSNKFLEYVLNTLIHKSPENKDLNEGFEAGIQTMGHNRKDLLLRWEVLSGYQETWAKILVSATDLSSHKKIEEHRRTMEVHLRETQKLESLGVLAGGIAHDFNNLLVGVLGNADLALEALPFRSTGRRYIEQAKKAATRAADLTQQLLAYSGQGRFVVQDISMNGLIEEMMGLLKTSFAKGAKLVVALGVDLPAIEADPTQIRQVLMNLIMNASDALEGKPGTVEVCTGVVQAGGVNPMEGLFGRSLDKGSYIFARISDTGAGMDPGIKDKIFDPFFTTKRSGRGLGLAAVLGIVRRQGGAITVDSRPGRGTTMTVYFPSSQTRSTPPKLTVDFSLPWKGDGTVMVIDDEETNLEVIEPMFEGMGFSVLKFTDSREAVEAYRTRYPEVVLVLMDMTMPGMDGWATHKELRRINGEVKTILMSGYSEQEAINHSENGNIIGFVQKPFTQRDLMARVREVLE